MIKLGIIACSNGMGHISRSLKLSNYLTKYFSTYIITDKKKFKKLNFNKKIKIIDSKNILDINLKKKKYNQNWPTKLKKKIFKTKLEILISDNLPEVVNLNLKCLIISNFFWHELWNIKNNDIYQVNKKIKLKKIPIIRNILFKNKNKNKKFIYNGFLGEPRKKNNIQKNLLIGFGSEDKINKLIKKTITKFINENYKKYKIYLDKKYFIKSFKNKNVFVASYSNHMFKNVDIAIIKPGFGILQNCFENNIYPVAFYNKLNNEFKSNAINLKKNKLGSGFKNFSDCLNFVQNNKVPKIYYPNKFLNGQVKILKLLKKISNNL